MKGLGTRLIKHWTVEVPYGLFSLNKVPFTGNISEMLHSW